MGQVLSCATVYSEVPIAFDAEKATSPIAYWLVFENLAQS
jgi:hypothetical protein